MSIQHFAQEQFKRLNKSCSLKTLKRLFRRGNLVWKRLRNSLKGNRDEPLFAYFKVELDRLTQQAKSGEIDLCYFDETGLNLKPNVPYAWQLRGTTALLPAERTRGVTLLGILDPLKNRLSINRYQGAANAQCVIQTLDAFSLSITKKTVLVLDNASIHKAKVVQAQQQKWRHRGLFLQFIPAYSPELNRIEILWKRLKHTWLKPQYYASMDTLIQATDNILTQFGERFQIQFR